jgi:hypothetical protein
VRDDFTLNDITMQIDRIERLCTDNELEVDCSPNAVARILADEPNKLTADQSDQVTISFFPLGIDKQLLLQVSPLILMVAYHLFVGHERRWRRLIAGVRARFDAGDLIMAGTLWATTDRLGLGPLRGGRWNGGRWNECLHAGSCRRFW